MQFKATARKWRPSRFDQVVGQVHVTQALKNAIEQQRLAQAYLFSGPRGVGKTTLARLIAKCLNSEGAPRLDPPPEDPFCVALDNNTALDYQEIDGASNRGIDQIRDLNQRLKYASAEGKHRVFVIDEVHMLTIEAFNALLKSLEEPPEKVIFVFCTTEPHKVPITIRSRCQHYAFRAFSISEITDQLKNILSKDNTRFEEEALFYVARSASGSMRDSQSILDQVLSYGGGELKERDVKEVLGLSSKDSLLPFLENLLSDKLAENYKLLHTMLLQGQDLKLFFQDLLNQFNTIYFYQQGVHDIELLEVLESDLKALEQFSKSFTSDEIFLLNETILEMLRELKAGKDEQSSLQWFLVKIHRFKKLVKPEDLKAGLLHIASRVEAGVKPASNTSNEKLPPSKQINSHYFEHVSQSIAMESFQNSFQFKEFKQGVIYLDGTTENTKEEIWDLWEGKLVRDLQSYYTGEFPLVVYYLKHADRNERAKVKSALALFGGKVV